jgi:hypothetical protein
MKRRGFQLIELIWAFALLAGVVLAIMELSRSNTRNAQRLQARCAARLVLLDVSELLAGETVDRLREVSQGNSSAQIDQMVENRVTRLPESCRGRFRAEIAPVVGHMKCNFDEDVNGSPGLSRLRISLSLADGQQVQVVRLFRPAARYLPDTPSS